MKKRKRIKRAAAREPSVEREPERGPRKHEPHERVARVAQAEVRRLTRAMSKRTRSRPDLAERADVCSRGLLARLWWALGVALCGSFRWQRRQEVADA